MNKILSAILLSVTLVSPLSAGQWDSNPETQKWFQSLHNESGYLCCGEEDGIKAPEYKERPDGTVDVYYHEKWHHAVKEVIINPKDHKVSYAIVWPNSYNDDVRCFMPGIAY